MSEKCPTTGKECFTKQEAKDQAAMLRRKAFMPSQRHVNPYRCPDWKKHGSDRHYHVGRNIRRRDR